MSHLESSFESRRVESADTDVVRVAFVVPAHNEQRHIERCLRSILGQELDRPSSVDVFVVDNESMDSTVEIARRLEADVVSVTPGKPGRARNVGASSAECDYLAFVDADCVLPDQWLAVCLEHLQDSGVVAVGAVQAEAGDEAPWVERCWVQAIVPNLDGDWETIDWLPAFNVLIRKSVFDEVGGFDESLATCEDSDLSYRLAAHGELRRVASVPVRHLGESQTLAEFIRREIWRSRGNLRSALKRRAVLSELPSLAMPVIYWLLCIVSMVLFVMAVFQGGNWWTGFLLTLLSIVLTPMAIAFQKVGFKNLVGVTILVAAYLVARALGPVLPAARVSRS